MPAAGEDRMESIYRNPVGAQSNMPLEGQQESGMRSGGRVSDDTAWQRTSSNSGAKEATASAGKRAA